MTVAALIAGTVGVVGTWTVGDLYGVKDAPAFAEAIMKLSVSSWPIREAQHMDFSVSFGENRRWESFNQRRFTTQCSHLFYFFRTTECEYLRKELFSRLKKSKRMRVKPSLRDTQVQRLAIAMHPPRRAPHHVSNSPISGSSHFERHWKAPTMRTRRRRPVEGLQVAIFKFCTISRQKNWGCSLQGAQTV